MAMKVVVALVLLCGCGASYVSRGSWIVNATSNQRLHLKCMNWYGAHMESFVVAGLHVRSVGELAQTFASTGANCVRIPVSVDLTAKNPVVDPKHLSAVWKEDCESTYRALDVMDCVVKHLRRHDILLIFNSHTSMAGWVGPGQKVSQGLWNLGQNYSTWDWIQSMEVLVRRYKMFGFDLRNEIHDQDGVVITWGKTEDIHTDWLAASSLASKHLRAIDKDLFIIVGGLCWNLDLRPLMKDVGPSDAFDDGKLIYTSHVYSWSFWWQLEPSLFEMLFNASIVFSFISLLISLMCAVNYFHRMRYYLYKTFDSNMDYYFFKEVLYYFVSTSCVFHLCWLVMGCIFVSNAQWGGCSTLAEDARWLVVTESVAFVLTFLMLCYWVPLEISMLAWFFLWIGLFFVSAFVVLCYLRTDGAIYGFLSMWALDNRPVPVWVGEFGTVLPGNDRVFGLILDFIVNTYNLDFAYWPFNGDNYRFGKFSKEGFGIMEPDYVTVKNYTKVFHTLFG